jgi:transcriptional regulator with XRE-family HTH domain
MKRTEEEERILRQFGERLRKLRNSHGYTQETLADKAKMHFTYVGQIERGVRNPSLINLHKLAKALNVTGGELFPF